MNNPQRNPDHPCVPREEDAKSTFSAKMILPMKTSVNNELPNQRSKWTAQPVLQWIESLAIATEKADGRGSVLLGNANLSEPTPVVNSKQETLRDKAPEGGGSLAPQGQCSWDLSPMEKQDPLAWVYTRNIRSLAGHLEELIGMAKPSNCTTTEMVTLTGEYTMMQKRLAYIFQQLVSQQMMSDSSDMEVAPDFKQGELRTLLDALYDETIHKLNVMIGKQRKEQFGEQPSPQKDLATTPMPKQELANYMTDWLLKNWINPYPDDDGLKEIATHCGTTTQVISNWLINARTRKWRPALQQACNMDRPSDMLLEDSLNIFKGNTLRPLSRQSPSPPSVVPSPQPMAYYAEKGRFQQTPSPAQFLYEPESISSYKSPGGQQELFTPLAYDAPELCPSYSPWQDEVDFQHAPQTTTTAHECYNSSTGYDQQQSDMMYTDSSPHNKRAKW